MRPIRPVGQIDRHRCPPEGQHRKPARSARKVRAVRLSRLVGRPYIDTRPDEIHRILSIRKVNLNHTLISSYLFKHPALVRFNSNDSVNPNIHWGSLRGLAETYEDQRVNRKPAPSSCEQGLSPPDSIEDSPPRVRSPEGTTGNLKPIRARHSYDRPRTAKYVEIIRARRTRGESPGIGFYDRFPAEIASSAFPGQQKRQEPAGIPQPRTRIARRGLYTDPVALGYIQGATERA